MLNWLVREGEENYIEGIRYRRRLKIFENFLCFFRFVGVGVLSCSLISPNLNLQDHFPASI